MTALVELAAARPHARYGDAPKKKGVSTCRFCDQSMHPNRELQQSLSNNN
jgi:hypothetical protein